MSVIETEFHLFQVQQELVSGNPIVPLQFGLGRAPEVLDAVDVPTVAGGESFTMIDPVMPVALRDQPIVAGELVRVDRGAFGHLWADHRSKGLPGHSGDRTGVHLAAPLQEPEDGHFPGCTSAPESFPVTAKVGLIGFDLSAQRGAVFTVPRQMPTDEVIHALSAVTVDPDDASRLHSGDLQGEEVNELVDLSVR